MCGIIYKAYSCRQDSDGNTEYRINIVKGYEGKIPRGPFIDIYEGDVVTQDEFFDAGYEVFCKVTWSPGSHGCTIRDSKYSRSHTVHKCCCDETYEEAK